MHRFRPRRQLINLSFVLVGWSSRLLPGLAAKVVFDHIAHQPSGRALGWLLWPFALLAGFLAANTVTAFTLQSTNGAFAYANATMLQRNLLRRILKLPGSTALPASPGEAVSRFRDDTEAVIWYPIQFNNVIGSAIVGTLALIIMARINPAMTVLVFLPVLGVVAIVEAMRSRIVTYRQANRMRTSDVTGFIGDVFASVQTIQVANAERRTVERFRQLNTLRLRAAVRDRLLDEVLKGAFWVVNLGTGVILVFAGRGLRSGSFTVGDLALFVYYLNVFQEFTADLGGGLAGYRQLGVSFTRMLDLLAGRPPADLVAADEIYERGALPEVHVARAATEPLSEFQVEGLTYLRGRPGTGVEDVSLTLRAGSFSVVTGRIGAGKTTLLQGVLGLVPARGTLRWNGEVIDDPSTFMAPPRAAYTPQVPQLFSESLEDNIRLGWPGDIDEAVRLAVMETDVDAMPDGLATLIGSRGVRLSGGQVQRTAAARMLVRGSDLLVCDDLSSALDVDTEAVLWDRILAGRSRTVLAVSHRRAALRRADQVVVLCDGRVCDVGRLDDLLARCEEMRRLWRVDAAGEAV